MQAAGTFFSSQPKPFWPSQSQDGKDRYSCRHDQCQRNIDFLEKYPMYWISWRGGRALNYTLTIFRKPDLDTVLSAFILLRDFSGMILAIKGQACAQALANKKILCLECGGSGRTNEGNFDHHSGAVELPCAAEQAWNYVGRPQSLSSLVSYVASVDTARMMPSCTTGNVSLSSLFSGMLLVYQTQCTRFRAGLRLLDAVCKFSAFPYDLKELINNHPEFLCYLHAKEEAKQKLEKEIDNVKTFYVKKYVVKSLCTQVPGVHGLLRRLGADISIAGFKNSSSSILCMHWSISFLSNNKEIVDRVLCELNNIEKGWGGPTGGTILGSPFTGSKLSLQDIIEVLSKAIT